MHQQRCWLTRLPGRWLIIMQNDLITVGQRYGSSDSSFFWQSIKATDNGLKISVLQPWMSDERDHPKLSNTLKGRR
jgi:hypothetical protein